MASTLSDTGSQKEVKLGTSVSPFSRGLIFTRAHVSLALLPLRENEGLIVEYILMVKCLGFTHPPGGC